MDLKCLRVCTILDSIIIFIFSFVYGQYSVQLKEKIMHKLNYLISIGMSALAVRMVLNIAEESKIAIRSLAVNFWWPLNGCFIFDAME